MIHGEGNYCNFGGYHRRVVKGSWLGFLKVPEEEARFHDDDNGYGYYYDDVLLRVKSCERS